MAINVTVENQGGSTETFNVTTFYNETAITFPDGKNYTTVTLAGLNSTTFEGIWNTTDVPYGNYTIKAEASTVPEETDTEDNTLIEGWVVVTIPGDVDGDRIVDIYDLARIGRAYGAKESEPHYDPEADINCDGTIDIYDLALCRKNYGKTDP